MDIRSDPNRPYLSGVLVRFKEGWLERDSFAQELGAEFALPACPEFTSEKEKAEAAACSEALSIAVVAMLKQRKIPLSKEDDISVSSLAIGLGFAMLVFADIRTYLTCDDIEIETITSLQRAFVNLFLWLDETERKALVSESRTIVKAIIDSKEEAVQKWRENLMVFVEAWLLSAASDNRTKEGDEELRQSFAMMLGVVYKVYRV